MSLFIPINNKNKYFVDNVMEYYFWKRLKGLVLSHNVGAATGDVSQENTCVGISIK